MAAVAYPISDPWAAPTAVSFPRPRSGRPDDRERPGRPDRGVYRRRRAVALLALVTVAVLAAVSVRLALAGSGGGALTTSGSAGAAVAGPVAGQIYVVQPGDSLWSIVQRIGHHGDPRPVVDKLALELNGAPLLPGQRLRIP